MASIGPWLGGGGGGGGGRRGVGFGSPFSSDIWDPFLDVGGSMTAGWRRGGGEHGGGDEVDALSHANVDWRETDKAHIFRVDLPGVKKEDLKVHLEDNNTLQISGERVKEQEEVNDKWHRVERKRGSFMRKFRLPENVEVEEIKCGLENGVLTVTVPKKEMQETPRNVRQIDVA